MHTNKYEKANVFRQRLRYLTEKEYDKYNTIKRPLLPPPPDFLENIVTLKNNLLLVKINKNLIYLNNQIISIDDLEIVLLSKLHSGNKYQLIYFITDDSKYQQFIDFNSFLINLYYDVRDELLLKKNGTSFRAIQRTLNKELIKYAKEKYPMKFMRVTSEEYNNLESEVKIYWTD